MNTRGLRWAAVFVVLALAVFFEVRRPGEDGAPLRDYDMAAPARVPAIVRSLRPNYPYSVIPGGIYSPEELRYGLANDPIVQEHYRGFDARAARLVVARTDHFEYVSYRTRAQIFWTGRKLRIPKGEVLISDGAHLARTRCGNRLSEAAVPPMSGHEPSAAELSLPPFSMDLLNRGLLTFAPPPLSRDFPPAPLLRAGLVRALGDGGFQAADLTPTPVFPPLDSATTPRPWAESGRGVPFGSVLASGIPVSANARPAISAPSSTATTSTATTLTGIADGVAVIPEPRGLALFAMLLFGSSWALVRLRRTIQAGIHARGKSALQMNAVRLVERGESR